MTPIMVMMIVAVVAVVIWARLDRKAFEREVDKLREDEAAYRSELAKLRAE